VRYCSDGDFRSLLNSVMQGVSGPPRPGSHPSSSGSAEVWDNSMLVPAQYVLMVSCDLSCSSLLCRYSSFNRGFGSCGKGDDDFSGEYSMPQGIQEAQGGSAKRHCSSVQGLDDSAASRMNYDRSNTPSKPFPYGIVAPPLRVASPLVLRCPMSSFLLRTLSSFCLLLHLRHTSATQVDVCFLPVLLPRCTAAARSQVARAILLLQRPTALRLTITS
jgi:hypothetical protein